MDSHSVYAVIGDPIAHSLSPAMQTAAFKSLGMDAEYIPVHVRPETLAGFAEEARRRLRGFNITVPHKGSIIKMLDEVSPAAELASSVNTVSVKDGRLTGDSTDGYGLETALQESFGFQVSGGSVCFIGCGGAVQAVAFHFASQGVKKLRFLNRTIETAKALCSRLSGSFPGLDIDCAWIGDIHSAKDFLSASQAAVQGTSLGLKPEDPPPIPVDILPSGICLYETIYKPTPLLESAKSRGVKCANGLSMLLHQGAKSFSIWTGRPAPVEAMRKALHEAFAARL